MKNLWHDISRHIIGYANYHIISLVLYVIKIMLRNIQCRLELQKEKDLPDVLKQVREQSTFLLKYSG